VKEKVKEIVGNFSCSLISLFDREVLIFDIANAENQHFSTGHCKLLFMERNDETEQMLGNQVFVSYLSLLVFFYPNWHAYC
jgi:hypothetical protein